jgi:rubredoxin-NAD+ reductase
MAGQLNAALRAHVRVTAVDPARHAVNIGAERINYSKLVLALGADQLRVPLKGSAVERVMTVNDLESYTRLRAALKDRRAVAVIGAGLIGCEFANDLTSAGFKVDVIDIAGQPLPRLLPPAGGALLQRRLAALGVTWHLGSGVAAIDGNGDGVRITLADGAVFDADVVLSAIGLKPRIALARGAGIKTNRGIVVSRSLQTSAPDVYALGDCAEVEGLVLPFVMPIMHAARALAATLAGKPTPVSYPAMPVVVKTPACPTVVSPPPAGAAGAWSVTADDESVKALFLGADGKLLGFALNGKATSERAALTQQLPPVLAQQPNGPPSSAR